MLFRSPESYDRMALLKFVADVKSGVAEVSAPVYSHLVYDIVDGETNVVRNPEVIEAYLGPGAAARLQGAHA